MRNVIAIPSFQLSGLVLLTLLSMQAHAATISVGANCTLANAVANANDDDTKANPNEDPEACAAGDGADTVVLPSQSTQSLDAASIRGSGLLITTAITIEGNNSTITRGSSSAFRIALVRSGGSLTLNATTISGGSALDGGGLSVSGKSTLVLNNSTVSNNVAALGGGGISVSDSWLTLNNSTVSGNAVLAAGGGILVNKGGALLTNSTVSGNLAVAVGGGVSLVNGELSLVHSTVSDNVAASGGGLGVANGSAGLQNSLIAGNFSVLGAEVAQGKNGSISSAFSLYGHDDLSFNQAFAGFSPGETDKICTATLGVGPVKKNQAKLGLENPDKANLRSILEGLGPYGGITKTHGLTFNSPAIGAANAETCIEAAGGLDQRGAARLGDGQCDIGAMERLEGIGSAEVAQSPDSTPDAFEFPDREVAGPTLVTSKKLKITGINVLTFVSITGNESAQFRVNDGKWRREATHIWPGARIQLRQESPAELGSNSMTINIGDVSDEWAVTTAERDDTPDAFDFEDRTVPNRTVALSNVVIAAGFNVPVRMGISGDESARLVVNGQLIDGDHATVRPGDRIRISMRPAEAPGSASATANVNGVSDTWVLTTEQ